MPGTENFVKSLEDHEFWREAVALSFPNRHVGSIILPSKYFCLHAKKHDAVCLDYKSFLFYRSQLLQRFISGKRCPENMWPFLTTPNPK